MSYDVKEDLLRAMREVDEGDFYDRDALYQYKNIVDLKLFGEKIVPVCPFCEE